MGPQKGQEEEEEEDGLRWLLLSDQWSLCRLMIMITVLVVVLLFSYDVARRSRGKRVSERGKKVHGQF